MLMKVALEKNIRCLQVLGDFKLLMDWDNGKFNITYLVLESIMALCLEKKSMFEEASFFHIYMDFNKKNRICCQNKPSCYKAPCGNVNTRTMFY
jgi:hypothetical protein